MEPQKYELKDVDACVRTLDRDTTHGCATTHQGDTAPLILITHDQPHNYTTALYKDAKQPVALAVHQDLFNARNIRRWKADLGTNLKAIAVLQTDDQPTGASAYTPPADDAAELAAARYDFGIVLLSRNESRRALEVLQSDTATFSPMLELRYPMNARRNSLRCLSERSCLPIGGYTVWGSVEPRGVNSMPPVAGKRTVLLSAPLDATSFFHEHATGADAAASSIAAIVGAVDAVARLGLDRLRSLQTTPIFALFAAEAWDATGSRRFANDVAHFHCDEPMPAPPTVGSALPPLEGCQRPLRVNMHFATLRDAPLRSNIHIGPVGAAEANGTLHVHGPARLSPPVPPGDETAAEALLATAPSVSGLRLRRASDDATLPPGSAATFAHSMDTAVLCDYNVHARARVGSRFDIAAGLDRQLVCEASAVAARGWWRLASGGAVDSPTPDCSLIDQVLDCLDGDAPISGCALADALGIHAPGNSRYASVYQPGTVWPTSRFVHALLRARLNSSLCSDGASACEPTLLLHDALSPALEYNVQAARFEVQPNASQDDPIWAESNWPSHTGATLWLYTPSNWEAPFLIAIALVLAALTQLSVVWSGRLARQFAMGSWRRMEDSPSI